MTLISAMFQQLTRCCPTANPGLATGLELACTGQGQVQVQGRSEEEKRISEGHGSKSALNRFALRSYQSLFATSCYRCLEGTIFICW